LLGDKGSITGTSTLLLLSNYSIDKGCR